MPVSNIEVTFTPLPEARERTKTYSGREVSPEWLEAAKALQSEPFQWAQVTVKTKAVNAGTTASYIRHGKLKAFQPAGHFEAVVRPALEDPEQYGVFVRYVGEQQDPTSKLLDHYTVAQLKDMCKEAGLKTNGNKAELTERLVENGIEVEDNE